MPIDIVETVTGATTAELREGRDKATGDLVELRLDGVRDPDVAGALAGRRTPVIVTCRAAWEGGRFDGSEDERLGLLSQAIALGAEYVDVEWAADRRRLPRGDRTRLIVSHHDFASVPGDLAARVQAMAGSGDIVKVAVTPARLDDCLVVRDAVLIDHPHIAIVMGATGQVSRLCPWLFGSRWTYGGAAAPGQVSVAQLRDVYRVHRASPATEIYGVAGLPLGHSASPAMHNAAMGALGLDAIYVAFETADADELLRVAEAFGVRGLSVTAPLKERTFAAVSAVDALSQDIGALNTLRRTTGGWEGRNFDVAGFLSPFDRRGRRLEGTGAVVLGAGGAARTAVWALRSRDARVSVSARRADRAEALARELGVATTTFPPPPGWDLLVNTTPVGTWPNTQASPVPPAAVRGGTVYDLIYNPEETALLAAAREAGAETIGGLEMLVGQACEQLAWWTGRAAPRDVVHAAAAAFVAHARSLLTKRDETQRES